MAWAMDVPPDVVESSTARHVLLVLANYADQEGRHAFPAVSTIARQTGLTVRSIRQTLASLLEAEGLAGRRVAVEVNGMIVPRGQHASQQLADGDRVEIVHALGGG